MKHKEKSLRQLAKDIGESHSYLSKIIHGKRIVSKKVVSSIILTLFQVLATINPLGR
jgi:hypothetical protein